MRALAVVLALVVAGCSGGGGGRGPSPKSEPLPAVTPQPVEPVGHRLDVGTYAYAASPAVLGELDALGVTIVLDYDQTAICERVAHTDLEIIFPFYFGRAEDPAMIDQITDDQARNVAGCRDRVAMVYVADEPALQGIPARVVNAWLASVRRAFPGVPTLIYEPQDKDLQRYAVDVRGLSFYGHDARDPAKVRARLARQPHDAGQRYAIVGRGFVEIDKLCCGGTYKRWTPAQVAEAMSVLVAEARRTQHATLFLPYLAQEPAAANNPAPNLGWLTFPETRAAIERASQR